MDTAWLARKGSELSGDYAKMAEAIGEEIDDPAAGLGGLSGQAPGRVRGTLHRKIIGLFGVQIVISR